MNVTEVMTRDVVFAAPDCPLDEAIRLFESHSFRHLPVVDGKRLVGMISDRDIALSTGWILASHRAAGDDSGPQSVGEVMAKEVRSLDDDAEVRHAADLFLEERIGALPIVKDDLLVGILTTTDLLRACRAEDSGVDWRIREDATVENWMSREVKTVAPEAPMFDALDLCKQAEVRHLPVLEGTRIVGMVSDRDLRFGLGQEIVSDQVAQNEGRLEVCEISVDGVMTTEVVTVDIKDSLAKAADLLIEHGFSALPVLEGGKLAGILTHTDILRSCR